MERIETLRILAEARNAFNKVLENHGIHVTSWNGNRPHEYGLFIDKPWKPIAKVVYSQEIFDESEEK